MMAASCESRPLIDFCSLRWGFASWMANAARKARPYVGVMCAREHAPRARLRTPARTRADARTLRRGERRLGRRVAVMVAYPFAGVSDRSWGWLPNRVGAGPRRGTRAPSALTRAARPVRQPRPRGVV